MQKTAKSLNVAQTKKQLMLPEWMDSKITRKQERVI